MPTSISTKPALAGRGAQPKAVIWGTRYGPEITRTLGSRVPPPFQLPQVFSAAIQREMRRTGSGIAIKFRCCCL
jgi:hypothetical protein